MPDLAAYPLGVSIAAFLGVADAVYRKANLEHAAASAANLMQAALFLALLTVVLLAIAGPELSVAGVHPATPPLVGLYVFGFRLVRRAQTAPMWRAEPTRQAVTAAAGFTLMRAAAVIAEETPLSETAVGSLLTASTTSLPELATTIAAVRQGAVTLAVGNIVGTNAFNTLGIAAADLVHGGGSIYHVVTRAQTLWGLLAVLMTAILLLYLAAAVLTLAAG